MRLVTWNVNSLKARLPRVLELLGEHEPDLVCLQETKVTPAEFPHEALAEAGYHAVDRSAGQWAGVAIVARRELELADPVARLPGEPEGDEARWLEATVDGLRVGCVYVPNGRSVGSESFVAKLAFLDAMVERARETTGPPLVIAGDLNIAPADLDVYDPRAFRGSTHVTRDERSRLEAILDAGYVDAYRALHPDEVGYTWWDYRAGHFHKRMGLRIDLVVVPERLAGGLRSCRIDRDYRKGAKPSDHAPLLVDLDGGSP